MMGLRVAGDNKGHLDWIKDDKAEDGWRPRQPGEKVKRHGLWHFKVTISPEFYEKLRTLAEPEGLSVSDWLTNVMLEAIGIDTQQADQIAIESG